MADESGFSPPQGGADGPSPNLAAAYELLQNLLRENDGVVSSIQLKRDMIPELKVSEAEARGLVVDLQFLDEAVATSIGKTGAKTFHHGRSFYSEDAYGRVEQQTEREADTREQEAEVAVDEDDAPESEKPQNRQEEARLGPYVTRLLEDIYASDFAPDKVEYVFDVHNERPGSSYENVDLLAVHWRSREIVDLVAVEVKLQFSAKAVHQACNYARFSHRAWIAVVVRADTAAAAASLRGLDPGLFDYAVSQGIGIIACRPTQGRAYQAFPVQWPAWHNPEPVEKERFVDRYRRLFEQAGVVLPRETRRAARF